MAACLLLHSHAHISFCLLHAPARITCPYCAILPPRFKLNLVCRAWRAGLAGARQVWEELTVDPRKKACTSRWVGAGAAGVLAWVAQCQGCLWPTTWA